MVSDNMSDNSCIPSSSALNSSNLVVLVTLVLINIVVIIANLVVIFIVVVNKQLRSTNSNLFIFSLAVSDLTVGLFVLPFSAVAETLDRWLFGAALCRMWLALDVWLCTASIYNLVAITVDRYIAVTKPLSYKAVVTRRIVVSMIVAAWFISFCVCVPIIFLSRPELKDCHCSQMSNSLTFVLSSSTVSFYLPFVIILYFYCRIYARLRTVASANRNGFIQISDEKQADIVSLASKKSKSNDVNLHLTASDLDYLRVHKGGYCSREISGVKNVSDMSKDSVSTSSDQFDVSEQTLERSSRSHSFSTYVKTPSKTYSNRARKLATVDGSNSPSLQTCRSLSTCLNGYMSKKSRLESTNTLSTMRYEMTRTKYQKRLSAELKTLKTVGIVTGCMLMSWIGFCIIYVLKSVDAFNVDERVVSAFMWLGYVNSAINPFIYAWCHHQYRLSLKVLFRWY